MQGTTAPAGRDFYRRVARHSGLDFVDLGEAPLNSLAARLLSEEACRHFQMLPISYSNGVVTIASPEPPQDLARDTALSLTGRTVRFVVAPAEQVQEAIDDLLPDLAEGPAERAVTREEQEIVWRCLETIPGTYREPLVLFYREDQSIEAVAQVLEISNEAVRQRLSRGRNLVEARLARLLERALVRSKPTESFTLSVVAALPSTANVAGSVSVAAKAGDQHAGQGRLR